ncbi:hypothetical protein DFH08DRAFT_1043613 [Mycena albidolilacea]|uniref:Uncharacterized protein n=1 Tax=Mycena albidolilacea TaxID=1033008 RepID=A0AAD7AH50_9AGAR|nr:hypothetical protein DFH08DRAFT_1043613 [Mycena albidolilacea]
MPVSFTVAAHSAKPFPLPQAGWHTADVFFATTCTDQHAKAGEILQYSLGPALGSHAGTNTDKMCFLVNSTTSWCDVVLGLEVPYNLSMDTTIRDIVPSPNGFVSTLLDAYTQDRAVVIRPDDVWLAILSQFNFFVNAHAELLRANFVAHEGQKQLTVKVVGQGVDQYTVDFGFIARAMAGLVEENVVDRELRAWATPDFTTTTDNDRTVSAVLLMATLKKYFQYMIMLAGCGIPRITLEGERSDWHLLGPVLTRFVVAFKDPTSVTSIEFWQHVAHYQPGGSGRGDYYTGWITAFAVFDKEGRWMGPPLNTTASIVDATASDQIDTLGEAPETLTAAQFWAAYGRAYKPFRDTWEHPLDLVLDDTAYHQLNRKAIPPGYAEVDVLLDDNDEKFECAMVARNIGMHVSSSGDRKLSEWGADDTVHPVAGWWLFVKDEEGIQERADRAYKDIHGMECV